MRRDMMTARFKRDYVAFMAVFLFFTIILLEVGVAVWIPMQMRNEGLFADSMLRLQALNSFDSFRSGMRQIIKKSSDQTVINEAQMFMDQLDLLAIYLKSDDLDKKLDTDQVRHLSEQFRKLSYHYYRLGRGAAVSRPLSLDVSKYIKLISEDKI